MYVCVYVCMCLSVQTYLISMIQICLSECKNKLVGLAAVYTLQALLFYLKFIFLIYLFCFVFIVINFYYSLIKCQKIVGKICDN